MKTDSPAALRYQVVRSERATTDIVIEPDGRLVVRAPTRMSETRVAGIVEAKSYWIHRNLAEWRDLNAVRLIRELRNGEGFLYLGRSYRLRLVSDQQCPLMLKDGRFRLRRDLAERGDSRAARAAFRDYYTAQGHAKISARTAYFAPKVGVSVDAVDVRDLGRRWASCSPKGRLAFHWKCMMAPLGVIDYIIAHELCHLRHRDHDDAFWNEVDKVMPAFRERKYWLRVNGAALDL